MTIDRDAWERRWAAVPELRPEGVHWISGPTWEGWWTDHTHCRLPDLLVADLILARAVTWLVEHRMTRLWNCGDHFHAEGTGFAVEHSSSLLDALGAAIDAVLAARKETT